MTTPAQQAIVIDELETVDMLSARWPGHGFAKTSGLQQSCRIKKNDARIVEPTLSGPVADGDALSVGRNAVL